METLQRIANRGSISTAAYEIDNSLKFERANGEQVFTSNAAAGNRKTWTFSAWIKRTQLSQDYSTVFSCGYSNIQFMSNDRPRLILYNGSSEVYADPEMLMRDTSAWYHIVVQVDSTQSTAADRVKWWINGDRVTDFNNSTYTNMSQNEDFDFGQAGSGSDNWIRLGEFFGGSEGFSGYMADVYYLNGTAAQASDFGEYDDDSGIWIPKKYTGSGYGTQGFKYEFKDSSALGTDTSGEGHNANNLSNITAADQATDTPTNNSATWNALFHASGANDGYAGGLKIIEGATEAAGISGWDTALSTIAPSSGKWYAEFYITGSGSNVYTMIGVAQAERFDLVLKSGGYYVGHSGSSGYSVSLYGQNGATYPAQDDGGTASRFSAGDIISVALDMDNHKIYWAKNGSWLISDNPASNNGYALGWTGDTYFGVSQYDADNSIQANFGGFHDNTVSSGNADSNGYGNFEYSVPSGYFALNTYNLNEES